MQRTNLKLAALLPATIASTVLLISQQRQMRHWFRMIFRAVGSSEVDAVINLLGGMPVPLPALLLLAGVLLAHNCIQLRIKY